MKVIESLDEWYEALEADRLEFRTGGGEWLKSMADESKDIGYVKEAVAQGIYRWAPEQIKLFKYEDKEGLTHWVEDKGYSYSSWNYICTVIAEVITDEE